MIETISKKNKFYFLDKLKVALDHQKSYADIEEEN